ncbi:AAA family ATPase [Rhodococcus qingshengii]|uniref:AAA family ATPase n=1 Tax=Rhodococcus qingshengii TaxID=334542 RepID=UPI0021B0EEDC|nr:AAA family ATPase [Rhodococcus qingshengii]MCT6736146.1 AAA family ATPase [Rhodococcus qingshengii]MDJ0434826.1 AAA family ATPase [Rhodococcus qingshengii]
MKLHYIELTNFRQFQGTQRFNLESSDKKPVSLLFGANGAGKTTLLNAFTWALYGSLSDDVEVQDQMVTDIVWRQLPSGSSAKIAVELVFQHEGQNYKLLRSASLLKEDDKQPTPYPDIALWANNGDGQSVKVDAPQQKISSILPQSVSRFFFFNGERIEKLVQKGAYSEVKQDIKALLNIEHVERAIAHLPKVDRKITATLKDRGGEQASELQREIDEIEDRQTQLDTDLQTLDGELSTFRAERDGVLDLLRKHAEVAPIQKRRDQAVIELTNARSSVDMSRAEQANIIATRGFLAFTDDLVAKTSRTASTLYEKGALPAPLKREFVDRLLDSNKCICHAPLVTGSDARTHVQEWRQKAGLQAVETAWQQLNGQIIPMKSARADLREALQESAVRLADASQRASALEAEVSELSGQLKNTNLEDVQRLEDKRIDFDKRIIDTARKIESARIRLEDSGKMRAQKQTQLNQAEVKDGLASKARDRSELVRGVQRALNEILAIRSDEMRRRLEAELQAIFGSITIKKYTPRLNANFELTLHQDVDGVELQVPKSTGENQILSVSFVAAVSKLAREIRTEHRAEGDGAADSGTYPIVMDAAFGSLDKNYQKEVSRALARLAPQLIVLVSKSQGMGEVINELRPHVSNMGVLVTNTTSLRDVSEFIEIDGSNYPYIRAGAESNHTQLEVIGQ